MCESQLDHMICANEITSCVDYLSRPLLLLARGVPAPFNDSTPSFSTFTMSLAALSSSAGRLSIYADLGVPFMLKFLPTARRGTLAARSACLRPAAVHGECFDRNLCHSAACR